MSDNDIRVGAGYPLGQLARALTTAGTHEDAATRQRAELRVRRWQQVVDGMAGGGLDIAYPGERSAGVGDAGGGPRRVRDR